MATKQQQDSYTYLDFAKRAFAPTARFNELVVRNIEQTTRFHYEVAGDLIQATIEQEAYDRAEMVASSAAGSLFAESGKMPVISVRTGDAQGVIKEYLGEHPEVAALVLGAAAEGGPGPLVSHFSAHAGHLPCPLFVVPGGLTDEDIDRLS